MTVASSVAASSAVLHGCDTPPAFADDTLLRPQLLDAFAPDALRALGVAYRAAVPRERTADALRAALARAARDQRTWPWSPLPELWHMVEADFAADRVISVDGWLLAVTEARQCALLSLT